MSTAIERIMRERGDCTCFHEAFMYYYYVHLAKREFPFFDVEQNRPREFGDIIEMMQTASAKGPVFAKEMAYYVIPEITQHPDLASEFSHLFLVRDPRRSLVSYYRLDQEFQLEEVGLEAQWRLHQWVTDQTGQAPLVIEAEQVQKDPVSIMKTVWQSVGIPYKERAFDWDQNNTPEDWHQVSSWHKQALTTGSIQRDQRSNMEIDQQFNQTAQAAPHLKGYLDHHMPFYRNLLRYSV